MKDLMLLSSLWVKSKVEELTKDEKGAVDMVAIVVLIGIVILVAVVFRKALGKLVSGLFDQISGSANDAINNK